jgi:hypothetical protein
MNRWIMYMWQAIPGGDSADPIRIDSLDTARDKFEQFGMDMNAEDIVAALYAYSDDAWESAEEFRGIGNPFDYPDKIMERGPRGGILVRNA